MPSSPPPIRVGVIGLGFMGATHIAAYQLGARDGFNCQLVAVCDPKERRRRGDLSDTAGNIKTDGVSSRAFDPAVVRGYASADELIADEAVDLVSVCTRTDTHVELCVKLMEAGKDVLIEKPVAIKAADVQKVADAAKKAGRICMPAMCVRYKPAWAYLAEVVRDGSLGRCRTLTLQRLAASPRAGFADAKISGGALVDLHIHDADFVRWCFGDPAAVDSAGTIGPTGGVDHVSTLYRFKGMDVPSHVLAEGGWDHAPTFTYRMRYVAVFEHGTLDFDAARPDPLLLCRADQAEPITPIESHLSGYDRQTRALLTALTSGDATHLPTLDESVAIARLLHAEEESVRSGKTHMMCDR